jgi:hypothetical protein
MIADKFSDVPDIRQTFVGDRIIPLLDFYSETGFGLSDETPQRIPIGELIKVAPPFTIVADRRRKHNLLVCGSNDKMAENICNVYMLSALMNTGSRIWCIDGECLIGESISQCYYDLFAEFGYRFQLTDNPGEIIKAVNDIYSIYTERKSNNEQQHIFVFIRNLQFVEIVKKMLADEYIDESEFSTDVPVAEEPVSDDPFAAIDTFSFTPSNSTTIGAKLLKLIDEGSAYGISFIVSCTEYQTVKETMHYGSGALSKFPERIVFSLSDSEADNLINDISVSGLGSNTVYFSDGIKNTFQMKPFVMPSPDELKHFLENLMRG